MRANCVGCDGLTFMRFDHEKGALFPFWMIYANDRRDPDAGVPNRRILDINRADPFAPGLDHIFLAVGQPEKAEAIDRTDVPGVVPAIAPGALNIGEIAIDDPRSADLERTRLLTVPGERRAIAVDNAQFDAKLHATLLRQQEVVREILAFGHQERGRLSHQ